MIDKDITSLPHHDRMVVSLKNLSGHTNIFAIFFHHFVVTPGTFDGKRKLILNVKQHDNDMLMFIST